jgi:hypothetical protein
MWWTASAPGDVPLRTPVTNVVKVAPPVVNYQGQFPLVTPRAVRSGGNALVRFMQTLTDGYMQRDRK